MRTSVDIVVPCFNEAQNLPPLFLSFLDFKEQHKDEFELNLIIVDNGSTDDTSRVTKSFIAYEKSCRLIVLSRNFGKEASLSAGLLESTSDLVVPIDADLQDPIEVISDMLKCWRTHKPDVVLAKRISRDGDSLSRRLFSRMYLSLFSKLSDIDIPLGVGEFRLMSRKVVESFSQLQESERFVRGLFAWMGYKTEVIEFQRISRSEGKSRFSFSKLLNLGVDGIVSFSIKPLRIAISIGMATSGIAFIYSIVIAVEKINNNVPIPGYASLAVLLLILSGIQLLCIGVLGEYIGKTLMESKKRPIYLISEKYSNTEK